VGDIPDPGAENAGGDADERGDREGVGVGDIPDPGAEDAGADADGPGDGDADPGRTGAADRPPATRVSSPSSRSSRSPRGSSGSA
jgi:hypothetical protein